MFCPSLPSRKAPGLPFLSGFPGALCSAGPVPAALLARTAGRFVGWTLFVERGIDIVDVLLAQTVLCQTQAFANTINMKWITKEPPTLFFDGILTNSQLFCAFIKVPLQPYDLYWGYAAIFLRIHSLSSAIHQLSSKIWYSIIVAWR